MLASVSVNNKKDNKFLCCKELPYEKTKAKPFLFLVFTFGRPETVKGFVNTLTQNIIYQLLLYREVLLSKTSGFGLKYVLDEAVSMVNYIK